ncbi:MAG: aminotransferase class V-fold PLP-dependent enzyme [Planctomycetota bacterium]
MPELASSAPLRAVTPQPDWNQFRREMPVTTRWAYFDHAAVGAIPQLAFDRISRWSSEALLEGDAVWGSWDRLHQSTRETAARMVNASPKEISLVPNTSFGINLVAEGFPWQPGDNVVIPEHEFPSNIYPWMQLRQRGIELRTVPLDGVRVPIDAIVDAIDSRTRIVSASWVGYASGYRLDPLELGARVHERGALFFLDAIQGLGVFPLDVRQAPVDFFAADGHKWLLGPEGAGIFFLREEHLNLLRPLNIGWNSVAHGNDFSRVELTLRQSASRYESGTQNMAGFIGLGGSLETLHKYGLGPTHSAIAERVLDLTDQLAERMLRADWRLGSDRTETAVKSGILAFEVPGVDSLGLKQQLHGERVVLSYRGGKLRLAVHAFNSEEDFDRLFSAVRKLTGK